MLWLRPYKPCDADAIVSWIRNETVFRWWGGHRFGEYPIDARSVNDKYLAHNGDCAEPDNFYPFTAFDGVGPVGHFILRYLDGDRHMVRVGWVLLDSARRGQGLGREMRSLALRFAFDFLGAERVTLGRRRLPGRPALSRADHGGLWKDLAAEGNGDHPGGIRGAKQTDVNL